MTYDEALRVLSDVHKSFGENPPDTLDAKEEVYDTFQPHFRPGAIEDVSEQTITSFLDYGNNKHWSRLDRSKGKITRDLTSLREGLSTLVNEERKLAPRFTEAVDEVHGMGKAIATAILHVAYPDRYGVWNETSNQGMDRLDLLPEFERGASIGERYELVNDVLRALADDLSVDLWTLDFVWDRMVRGENEGQPGTATREPSSEARTDDTLKKAFETFLQTYLETRRTTDTASRTDEEGNTREVYTLMDTIQSVLERVSEAASSHLTVKKSLGRGNWVRNPWIAVYDEREHFEPFGKNKPPMAGTYVIYLFRADLTGVYLTYSQGFSRPVKELYNQDRSVGEALIQNRMERLRRRSQELQEAGFDLDSDIDLAAEGGQAPEYERSTIAHKFYQQGRVPADTDLLSDLDVLLRAYSRYMDRKHQRQVAITDAERLHQVVETVIRPAVEQGDLDPGGEEGYHHHEIIPGATPNLTPEALSDRPREAMLEALDADVNLLHHTWQRSLAKEFFRRAEPERIRDEIGALLYGPPPLTERVRDVLAWGSERTTEDGQTAKIEGTTASYLLCLSDPQEYAFCKTRGAYRPAVTALLGPDAVQKEWPERIAHARDFYKEVLRIFQEDHSELEFFDLMHVHIAFYLAEQAGAWNQQTGPTERTPEVKPARDPRVYKIAPGRNAKYWDDCREGGYICVGWDDVGDLRQFSNEGEYREAFYDEFMPDLYDRKQKASEKAGELWTLTDIEPGDLIVANRGESEVLAVGRVQEPGYEWSGDRDNHRHIVHVDWDESFRQDVHQPHWKVKTVKELPKDFVAQTLTGDRPDPYSIEEATQDLFYSKEEFRSWLNRLRTRKNVILQGPPGVGKTFVSKRLAYALMEEKAERRVQMVQFHQSYTYEDW
jgi:hypothetical protein